VSGDLQRKSSAHTFSVRQFGNRAVNVGWELNGRATLHEAEDASNSVIVNISQRMAVYATVCDQDMGYFRRGKGGKTVMRLENSLGQPQAISLAWLTDASRAHSGLLRFRPRRARGGTCISRAGRNRMLNSLTGNTNSG